MTHPADPATAPPSYADLGMTVRLLDGVPARHVRAMMHAIFEHAGAARTTIDWSNPDIWISALLAGELRDLAIRVWKGSGGAINPRYLYGHYAFVSRLKLLELVNGILRLGDRGQRFLAGDDSILRELVTLRSSRRRPSRPREDAPKR
jgi:hypothetical protein